MINNSSGATLTLNVDTPTIIRDTLKCPIQSTPDMRTLGQVQWVSTIERFQCIFISVARERCMWTKTLGKDLLSCSHILVWTAHTSMEYHPTVACNPVVTQCNIILIFINGIRLSSIEEFVLILDTV